MSLITLGPPSPAAIAAFIEQQRAQPLTYAPEGMTRGPTPLGFNRDSRRQLLGHGEAAFQRAVVALRDWTMFRQRWTCVTDGASKIAPPHVGQIVAVLIRVGPTWWTNSCRVLHLIDEPHPNRRVGFAYGTLPGHAERGEERFTVEMTADDSVWYDLLAYSQPRHLLTRIGYPMTRILQRRFGAGSAEAMRIATAESATR